MFGHGQAVLQFDAEQTGDVDHRDAIEVGFVCVSAGAVVFIVRHDASAP
jgi:hypothetical protein